MNRRDFLKWQVALLSSLATGTGALYAEGASSQAEEQRLLGIAAPDLQVEDGAGTPLAGIPDVAVIHGSAALATRKAVERLGGMGRFVNRKDCVVVIKPTMDYPLGPESAVTTSPEVVREVALMCLEAGAGSVNILDSAKDEPEKCLERSGIAAACKDLGPVVTCNQNTREGLYQESAIAGATAMPTGYFMRDALYADVLIAVPVAKSDWATGVSLALKGQMGFLRDHRAMYMRYGIDEAIADLNRKIRPHLSIIDATRVLSSGGPGGPGKILPAGDIIASADPVAADAVTVASYEWYGRAMKPENVGHIKAAAKAGIGRMTLDALRIARETV